MRMSEGFATTVAAVAPVVLLVAVVEVSNARPRLREAHDTTKQKVDELRAAAQRREALTEAEATVLERSYWSITWQTLKNFLLTFYLLAYAALAISLATVEYTALDWLATPGAGPQEDNARLCLYLVAGSFLWIILPGFGAVYAFMFRDLWLQFQGVWALLRIRITQDRRRPDADPEAS
ncbi:hypothetical protein [Streptomyces canus]|uniref:hypothetical protein n=1 Tax=Streptomyces canus TaxID=58343 RepID=UPI00386CD87B|nr:hypothetical protein OH824_17845 [Streptomyces canus]